jgi:hypothetical protein
VDGEERWVRAGVHRADSPQFPGAPVHADEVDAVRPAAFGIRPDVEEITVQLRVLAPREFDETDRRRGEEVAPRRLTGFGHRRLSIKSLVSKR